MIISSGPEQLIGRFLDSDIYARGCIGRRTSLALEFLFVGCFVLACTAKPISTYPSVRLTPDRQTIVVLPSAQATPSQLLLQNLPIESTIAPGLSYNLQQFELVRVSPDGRYAAFSAAGHHHLIALLNLATMGVREIDVVTEGDVVAFHWAADGRTFAYDYLPASGYRRVKGYDIESAEGLVVPLMERDSAIHVTFESWGPRAHDVILRLTDVRSNERRTETVTLIPHR